MGRFRTALVTGGAGFIGSHITDALVRAGVTTTVLDDLSSGRSDLLPPGVRLIRADVADRDTEALVTGVGAELVIHAAAQVSVPVSVADPMRDREVNLVGTERVLRGAGRGGARRFVLISSGGAIYGDTVAADEDTLPAPMSPYGIHKLAAEGYTRIAGLSYAIVRPSNVYGPRQRAGLEGAVVAAFVDALRAGRPVHVHGDGEQTRDLVHVSDVAAGVLAAADAERDGAWNLSTGNATSVNALLGALEVRLGPAVEIVHGPPRSGDVRASTMSPARAARDLDWRAEVTLDAGLDGLVRDAVRSDDGARP